MAKPVATNHVIITGAGSGLGLGMAIRYLKRGCNVAVLDLALTAASNAQLDVAAKAANAVWQYYKADITDFNSLHVAVTRAVADFGAPILAINSAGVVLNKAFADMQPGDFSRVININLNGSNNFAAAVLPTMKVGSRLALMASLAGITSNYAYTAYAASKFGVIGLATTLRYEYQPLGIHISYVCPPEVRTPMVLQERENANPIAMDLKALAGSLNIDSACEQIVAGLDAGRWQIIPGLNARLTAWTARYLPAVFSFVMLKLIKRAMRKHGVASS